jgi:hypothetical protein
MHASGKNYGNHKVNIELTIFISMTWEIVHNEHKKEYE